MGKHRLLSFVNAVAVQEKAFFVRSNERTTTRRGVSRSCSKSKLLGNAKKEMNGNGKGYIRVSRSERDSKEKPHTLAIALVSVNNVHTLLSHLQCVPRTRAEIRTKRNDIANRDHVRAYR